jgi:hypothetical protein
MGKHQHKRATEAGDREEKVPYLVFRYCRNKCFACSECGWFWGPAHDKLAGQPAHFGMEKTHE